MLTFSYICTAQEIQKNLVTLKIIKIWKIQNYHIYHISATKIRDIRMVLHMQSQFHPKDDLDK